MNTLSRTSLVITIIAVVLIGTVLLLRQNAGPITPTDTLTNIPSDVLWPSYEVESKHLDESGRPYTITAAYPVTKDERITLDLKAFVQNQIDQFKEDTSWATDPSIAPAEADALSLDVSYVETRGSNADNYIFTIVTYTGGAHGLQATATFSYDEHGKKLMLADLFTNGDKGLETIATYVMKVISSRKVSDEGWISEGAAPTVENYHAFIVEDKGITFTFDPYQVAPYAAGKQTVTVPVSAFKSIANPNLFK